MKKLMFAVAAIAAGIAVADVTSSNIVGYMDCTRKTGYNFACGGSMFVKPGQTSYNLYDLKITGPTNKNIARMNYIQFFATGTAAMFDKAKSYYYFGDKWWARTGTAATNDPVAEDFSISAGEGFLCAFGLASAKITYAGEVVTGGESKTLTVSRPAGYNYFVASNMACTPIKLSQISISGPTNKNIARMNYIQFFATGTAAIFDKAKSYYYFGGKWWARTGTAATNDPEADAENIVIPAGEGFLCAFGLASAKIAMPTSL